ncbi:DUF916 and DUF3324 domain-containing protein [Enterococcus mundtii]|uniref:Uncharacterized protein n=1 Tax=Enterococcus mundtii TaxID=53346 RepID=A0A242KFJ0_ENTMU|nr:DUF916 and DUF3324 domain-containing protein [Enterococcus mundtii]OTP19932.1 hypothetical protein A5802_003336 [Enterococcus mundtii]
MMGGKPIRQNVIVIKLLVMTIVAYAVLGGIKVNVYADNRNNFSIQSLNRDGEVNQQGFYHLIGQPGEKQNIAIKVFNASENEIRVKATVNPASTNNNGIPNYAGEEEYDSSLKYRMDELISLENDEIKIPASDSVIVKATVSFPDEDWEGDVLGGIRITEEGEVKREQTVVHEVAYTVGVLLNQKESPLVENNLQLHEVSTGQRNYRNHIEANLQNNAATIIREMNIKAEVFEKENDMPIYTYDAYDLRMAPNSNFDLGIPTGNQPIEAGDYLLKLVIKADEKEYRLQKAFTISTTEARQLNQSAVNLTKNTNTFIRYLIIVSLTLVVLVFYVWRSMYKRMNNTINK